MTDLNLVIAALTADGDDVDRMVADLPAAKWALETPSPGWTIAHQIAHLSATFRMAGLAASNAEAFAALASKLSPDFDANVRHAMAGYLAEPPDVLLTRWRTERDGAIKALAAAPPDQMVPWLVNPLPPAVLGMAGMMELFGHGQDIADALGIKPERTDRIQLIVAFAIRTWTFGYLARGLTPPETEFRFELSGPSGALWTFGPEDSPNRITGSAADFCLLVTRRRHRDDLDLAAAGAEADRWMDIAQAYRGPAGDGRTPGQFRSTT
ncbi:TIGR03084 family metal-binding protein [Acrocarpospora sp. B8E8]|uniref:TIGR03084 family metal-binding protein n=1 Tax=Acrocarpospora sp. B8E8 TaxID=3153572 RepID=UPI00325C502A